MKTFNIFAELSEMVSRGFARATDPDTSKEAALSIDVTNMEKVVLDAIKAFPDGCILEELERHLPDVRPSSISPRLRPLMRKGLVIDTFKKRPGSSGRNQRILKAVI